MARPRRIRPRMLAPSRILRSTPARAGGGRERDDLIDQAEESIREGSRSFYAASRLFETGTREQAWLLYAWCRRCDDLADAQLGGGKLGEQAGADRRITAIRLLTERAFEGLPTADAAFDAFGLVAREAGITPEMAEDVIGGFARDAEGWRPRTERDLMVYCYHVAGAVGVMMARIMGVKDDSWMLDRACDLGIAFQLANIARDMAEDADAGRCYIPMEWLAEEDIEPGQEMKPHHRKEMADIAKKLIALMERHEAAARLGAARLSFRSRWAVLAAANIYGAIGREVVARGPNAWDSRVFVGRMEKLRHIARALWEAIRSREPDQQPEMPAWTRGELMIEARMNAPIPDPPMEPLPEDEISDRYD
jgi:phytoene synthase